MIDYHKELRAALEAVLPTHYEMSLHSGIQTPCLSYMELNNYQETEGIGATLAYSRISYQVKVWANEIAVIQRYALEVDRALRPLGFKRISSGELYDHASTMIQKILTYEALASENL
jgi:hypothetical protein